MHFHEQLLRKGYEAYERGDVESVMSLFSDDIKWHSPGRNPVSGHYKGKDELLALFSARRWTSPMELSGRGWRTCWPTTTKPSAWSPS
jgi:hypothetical protein